MLTLLVSVALYMGSSCRRCRVFELLTRHPVQPGATYDTTMLLAHMARANAKPTPTSTKKLNAHVLLACSVALSGEASHGKAHHAREVQQAHDWCSIPALLTTRERLEKNPALLASRSSTMQQGVSELRTW